MNPKTMNPKTISEIIKLLEAAMLEYGDIEFCASDDYGTRINVSSVQAGLVQRGTITTAYGYFSDL